MAEVNLTVAADLSALRKQLESIPGLSADAAAKMTSELNKSIKASEKASIAAAKAAKAAAAGAGREAKKALDDASASVDKFGQSAGAVGSSAGKLAGALSLIGPGAGEAARSVADFADVGEVAAVAAEALGVSTAGLIAGLGALAVAVGGAYVAWRAVNEESERAATIAANTAAAYEAMKPILDATRVATIDLAVATGELTALEGQLAKNRMQAGAQFASATKESSDKIQELRKQQGSYITQAVDVVTSLQKQYDWIGLSSWAFDGLTTSSAELQQEIDGLHKNIATTADATKTLVERSEKAILAQEASRKVTKAVSAAQKEQKDTTLALAAAKAREAEAFAAKLRTVEEASLRADQIVKESGDFRMSEMDKLAEREAEAVARYEEAARAGAKLQEEIEAGKTEIARNYAEQRGLILEGELATAASSITELQAQIKTAMAEAAKRLKEIADATINASADLFGSVSDLAAQAAEKQGESHKKAAMTMFVVSKAAALAQAITNTFLAISSANTLPPPANLIAMAAASTAGAAQVAGIAASPPPSFNDTPGVQQMGTRGNVSLAAGDYFAAARDPAELQRQVGASGGGGVNILQVKLGHRVLDQSVARTIQQGGRLSREINRSTRTRPTGHREA